MASDIKIYYVIFLCCGIDTSIIRCANLFLLSDQGFLNCMALVTLIYYLQCFDTVGWASERASSL